MGRADNFSAAENEVLYRYIAEYGDVLTATNCSKEDRDALRHVHELMTAAVNEVGYKIRTLQDIKTKLKNIKEEERKNASAGKTTATEAAYSYKGASCSKAFAALKDIPQPEILIGDGEDDEEAAKDQAAYRVYLSRRLQMDEEAHSIKMEVYKAKLELVQLEIAKAKQYGDE